MRRLITAILLMSIGFTNICYAAAQPTQKLVALTFDDGPGRYTSELLDGLSCRGVKATFFTVGENIEQFPEIILRMFAEGHQIGIHSYSHKRLAGAAESTVKNELEDVRILLKKITGGQDFYLRPPYGAYDRQVRRLAETPLILWSVDTLDWKYRNADTVYQNIMKDVGDGDIILLHDIYSTSVAAALRAVDALLTQGYEFVTVRELLLRRGITPENGEVYRNAYFKGVEKYPTDTPTVAVRHTLTGTKLIIDVPETAAAYCSAGDGVRKLEKFTSFYTCVDAASVVGVTEWGLGNVKSFGGHLQFLTSAADSHTAAGQRFLPGMRMPNLHGFS